MVCNFRLWQNWFKSILVDACREDAWSPECAKVMACCEYDDVMEVMSHQVRHNKLQETS